MLAGMKSDKRLSDKSQRARWPSPHGQVMFIQMWRKETGKGRKEGRKEGRREGRKEGGRGGRGEREGEVHYNYGFFSNA